jgi:hypothetical protein
MAAVLLPTKSLTGEFPAAARLIFEVALGATVFTGMLMLLWRASGRPKGVEQIGTEVLLQAKERIWKLARSR